MNDGDFRKPFKEFLRGTGDYQISKVVLRSGNELPWPRGFQISATLDALLTFL